MKTLTVVHSNLRYHKNRRSNFPAYLDFPPNERSDTIQQRFGMKITPEIHLAMLMLCAIWVSLVCYMGLIKRAQGRTLITKQILGLTVLLVWLTYNIYYFHPSNFDWKLSLPLHACDIIGLIAGVAMLTSTSVSRSILYFCGLALATQAFITPIGNQDPETARFWLFWALHIAIIGCAIFDIIVLGYRPTLKDFYICLGADILYVMIVLPINISFGWNYGYLGDSLPQTETIVGFLGAWPGRVLTMLLLAMVLQYCLLLPWQLTRRVQMGRRSKQ